MSLNDSRGVPVSTSNPALLAALERATTLTASYFVDPLAEIDRALAEEPDFAMGHALKVALAVMSTERSALPMLADSLAAIDRSRGANARERAHAAAGRAWLEGDFRRAVELYGDILLDHPRDLVALQAAHIVDFLLGQSQMLRDRLAQVLPHWNADVPGYSYVLGMYAFGLEEMNLYDRAEETGRRALQLDPRDPWSVHAVTHVMEMRGRTAEGIRWLTGSSEDWAPGNGFAFHNWWHLALFHLDGGGHTQALDVYDRLLRPRPSQVAYENVDASAMLWRLSLRGVDVGDRWRALADDWAPAVEDGYYAFNDAHAVMAFIGAGRQDLLERALAAMARQAASGAPGGNGLMTRDVGLPLARGLVAFSRGDHETCIRELLTIRQHAHRFGGSHAQRDIVHLTLLEAALRSGRTPLAQALAAERIALKPESPFNRLLATRARG
jgi:tetratricopeptide (TPR) repeat protein